jgi:glycosyltransferase involved in cell wall biosynthesis
LPAPARPREAVRSELDAGNRPVLLSVGRLHRQKGLDVLLDAAATWRERPVPPLLVIAGDGPERDDLVRRAAGHHLDVRWLGYVSDRMRLAELFCAADLVVVPSRWEGSPLAVHEALMAGRPVVTTPVGGLPELLRPDEVVFVPPADAVALAAAVTRLLDHPSDAEAIAAAGRRAAPRWPDEEAAATEVARVYAEVLNL